MKTRYKCTNLIDDCNGLAKLRVFRKVSLPKMLFTEVERHKVTNIARLVDPGFMITSRLTAIEQEETSDEIKDVMGNILWQITFLAQKGERGKEREEYS